MTTPTDEVLRDEREATSKLLAHARFEMERAGVELDLREQILEMMRPFVRYGHSGGSADAVTWILNRLLTFDPLTPLTDDPEEWRDVSEFRNLPPGSFWQNKRDSSYFSNDRGKTMYSVDGTSNSTEESLTRRATEVSTVANAIGWVMHGDGKSLQIEVSDEDARRAHRAAEKAIDDLDVLRKGYKDD